RNLAWLQSCGYPVGPDDCYIAPNYPKETIVDTALANLVDIRHPRHVVIALGGGVQEKLGLFLKKNCKVQTAIHCIGAAIGFLSGDQVRIPDWADRWVLGWLFRCASKPGRFVPRYIRALQLPAVLFRHRDNMSTSSRSSEV